MSVCIIMGSASDKDVAEKAVRVLRELEVAYEIHVCSAHRSPDRLTSIVRGSGAGVFIAIAGLSAALPGAVAAHTAKPVIGVPVSGKVNMDSLLSVVQMPPGIPVAAVGLDRGDNAAVLAAEILALSDDGTAEAVRKYREKMAAMVDSDDAKVKGDLG